MTVITLAPVPYTPEQNEQISSMLLAGSPATVIGRVLCSHENFGWHTASAITAHALTLVRANPKLRCSIKDAKREIAKGKKIAHGAVRAKERTQKSKMARLAGYSMSSCTAGAMRELLVATDLMYRGYAVFRALSPNCSCDLMILHDGQSKRVEVRTPSVLQSGKITVGGDKTQCDVLAIVVDDKLIAYAIPKDGIVYLSTADLFPVCTMRNKLEGV